jgi:signal transduction histidine kinase
MNKNDSGFKLLKAIIKELVSVAAYLLKLVWGEIKKQYERFLEKRRLSLAFRITAGYVRRVASILLSLGFLTTAGFIIYLGWNVQGYLDKDYNIVGEYLRGSTEIPVDRIKRLAELDNLSITLFDKDRNILYSTKAEGTEFLDESYRWNSDKINERYILAENHEPIYYNWRFDFQSKEYNFGYVMAVSEGFKWNDKDIYIQIETKMIKESLSVIALMGALLPIDIMLMLGVIVSGTRVSKKILKPVHVMTGVVENITINELDTRLDVRGVQDELKDLARTFNRMLDRIQQSYEQQKQFVSDASHELRTPIAVIQGYANLLDRWGKNDEQVLEESIGAIKTESESMKNLVEQLLFLARGDKNTQKVEMEAFSLNELIDEVIKESRLIDNDHEINCEKNESITIHADRNLLKEALRIFVDNSIKYTPKGGDIKVDSFLNGREAVITVEDTGVGISKEDLPHIFDRFYRADKARTRGTGGTGLGLAIAKWIILKHNGRIDVKSEVNAGTKVSIIIPF